MMCCANLKLAAYGFGACRNNSHRKSLSSAVCVRMCVYLSVRIYVGVCVFLCLLHALCMSVIRFCSCPQTLYLLFLNVYVACV